MTICDGGELRRAGRFALEQFIVVSCGSTDLRWALAALALQSLSAAGAVCRVLLVSLAQTAARRAASAHVPTFAIRLSARLSRRSPRRPPAGPFCPGRHPC